MKLLVTGGAGFIGSALVRRLLSDSHNSVVVLDSLTYAGSRSRLETPADPERLVLEQVDIRDAEATQRTVARASPDMVIHLAAESHVDRSIASPRPSVETNVMGTLSVLEASRRYFGGLSSEGRARFRLHHVSTDEVYGSLGPTGRFSEDSTYDPRSPYSAGKAGADHLVRAWHNTYGLPVVISNCSNNYGPYQHPEKLIPTLILSALRGDRLPIYGDGQNVRDWLHVDDHVDALLLLLANGEIGESYCVGAGTERSNLEVAELVCRILDEQLPRSDNQPYRDLIEFIPDRPGHDRRYAMDDAKMRRELNWQPTRSFEAGMADTVAWYVRNRAWCEALLSDAAA